MTAETYEFTEADVIPETSEVEFPCQVCGREAGPYGGRGRKPKYCEEHKQQKSASKRSTPQPKNAALAANAADALAQINALAAFGATVLQYEATGETIRNANDEFRERAYQALVTDPDLCKAILRGGAMSGRAMLILSYGMLASVVAPVAVMEFREKKEAKLAVESSDIDGG